MGPSMEVQTFDRMTLMGRRWFFTVVDTRNWEPLAQSEAYNSAAARTKTASRFGVPIVPRRRK